MLGWVTVPHPSPSRCGGAVHNRLLFFGLDTLPGVKIVIRNWLALNMSSERTYLSEKSSRDKLPTCNSARLYFKVSKLDGMNRHVLTDVDEAHPILKFARVIMAAEGPYEAFCRQGCDRHRWEFRNRQGHCDRICQRGRCSCHCRPKTAARTRNGGRDQACRRQCRFHSHGCLEIR